MFLLMGGLYKVIRIYSWLVDLDMIYYGSLKSTVVRVMQNRFINGCIRKG